MLEKYLTWIKAHERLILVFMCLLTAGWMYTKWADSSAEKAKLQAAATAQLAAEMKSEAEKAAQASALTQAQYQQMVDTLSRQNQALTQAITSRDSVLGQKVTEVSKPKLPTEVSTDIDNAYQGQAPSVVTDSGQIEFDPTVVQKFTVTKIERDTFQADLSDETKVAANVQTELDKSNQLSGTLGSQIAALNNQIVADNNKCQADIKEVKATARAGKIKWFKIGFVSGLISGIWLGHSL